MNNIKYQNYLHYKLPITANPLEYGKLIEQIGNKYIITLTTPTNVAVINQIKNENFVKIFRKGDLMFEYKEIKISDIKFIRTISDLRFTFENNKLISTELKINTQYLMIHNFELTEYEDTNAIQVNYDKITPLILIILLMM
jgi:sporulation protein YlmC with PRC-barrel domain